MTALPIYKRPIFGIPLWRHLLVMVVIFVALIAVTVLAIVNSDAYLVAKEYAQGNPRVSSSLGSPTAARLGVGRMGFSLSSEYSHMRFPLAVTGSKSSGYVLFQLVRRGGDASWVIEEAQFHGPHGTTTLVAKAP
jgi:hypothetical protein